MTIISYSTLVDKHHDLNFYFTNFNFFSIYFPTNPLSNKSPTSTKPPTPESSSCFTEKGMIKQRHVASKRCRSMLTSNTVSHEIKIKFKKEKEKFKSKKKKAHSFSA